MRPYAKRSHVGVGATRNLELVLICMFGSAESSRRRAHVREGANAVCDMYCER